MVGEAGHSALTSLKFIIVWKYTMELVFQKKNKEITTSQIVAKVFSKNHSKVLRDIRELGCSEEFSRANFGLAKYKDKQG